jgi:hypothetical protein
MSAWEGWYNVASQSITEKQKICTPRMSVLRWQKTMRWAWDLSLSLWLYSLSNFGCIVGFLIFLHSRRDSGRKISPSQGRYLHIEQHKHRINAYRNSRIEWDSNPRSQCSSGRSLIIPQTAWPLWSAGCEMGKIHTEFLLKILKRKIHNYHREIGRENVNENHVALIISTGLSFWRSWWIQ